MAKDTLDAHALAGAAGTAAAETVSAHPAVTTDFTEDARERLVQIVSNDVKDLIEISGRMREPGVKTVTSFHVSQGHLRLRLRERPKILRAAAALSGLVAGGALGTLSDVVLSPNPVPGSSLLAPLLVALVGTAVMMATLNHGE